MPLALFGVNLPPWVALIITIGFVCYLFRRDIRERPAVTGALWIPLLWLLMTCSRPVSDWLRLFGLPMFTAPSIEEGSPFDACLYFGLIVAGLYVLNNRQLDFGEVIRKNGWIVVFLLYCFIAIIWSDFPFVAFKRSEEHTSELQSHSDLVCR